MRLSNLLVSATVVLSLAGSGGAGNLKDNLRLIQLGNGMKVFVYPRSNAPLFSAMVIVDAGSAMEQVGETGLAHLLEHMAFKGTPWIGTRNWDKERELLVEIESVGSRLTVEKQKPVPDTAVVDDLTTRLASLQKEQALYIVPNEYDQIITREGGQEVNASTDCDYTNYYMTLPSSKLEMWALMESQRLVYPAWREFYLERDVVAEERRMRIEDNPLGKLYENFVVAAFKCHPYKNPVIGWMPDIYNLTIAKIDSFYKAWYVPENMVAVIVGNVDPEQVRVVMEKYFGSIPARPSPRKPITVEPPQDGEKRVKVVADAEPQLIIGWHKPTFPDRDTYVFEVIQFLLTRSGRSSRLYERLVKNDGICQDVDSFTAPGEEFPNLYALWLTPRSPHSADQVEKAALEEVERLKAEPVTDKELQKIRNQIEAAYLKDLESNLGLAKRLGVYYIASKDPGILDRMRDEMKSVTAEDIQRVSRKYLTAENRTVTELVTRAPEKSPAKETTAKPAKQPAKGKKQ
jgi:predicted Zn-dependent peptidase